MSAYCSYHIKTRLDAHMGTKFFCRPKLTMACFKDEDSGWVREGQRAVALLFHLAHFVYKSKSYLIVIVD